MSDASAFDLKSFLRTLTDHPGVYRMLGEDAEVLYVGKARDLKRRVSSYFTRSDMGAKTTALVELVCSVEVTVTHTESEALILENHLIKRHQPRFNVMLRDDKGYPYIHLSDHPEYPRLSFHRGARRAGGRYFGPYPNAGAVRESLQLLQKLFGVRQCEDSFFRNRSRPCLQYQIHRCSGPCVGLVTSERYQQDVTDTVLVLEGKDQRVIDQLVRRMERAAYELEYEAAGRYRDTIANLQRVREKQVVSTERGDVDVVACVAQPGGACVQLLIVRGGHVLGNRAFFPALPAGAGTADALGAFLSQHYLDREVPREVIISEPVSEHEFLEQALSEQAGHRVRLRQCVRGVRARWLAMAKENAAQAMVTRLAARGGYTARLVALQEALDLEEAPRRLECFDISHISGEATVASCVVFDTEGPVSAEYRRFNIREITPGDDYGAIRQVLERRYTRLQRGEGQLPDLLFIDGGAGQLRQAIEVLEELQIDGVAIVGVAKGAARRVGEERLLLAGREAPFILPATSPALHLVQQIRDEAHRFAITGHRQRRAGTRRTSTLEGISGVGAQRRKRLLQRFGGLHEVARAGVEDLARVPGISLALAQRIYDAFHGEGQ